MEKQKRVLTIQDISCLGRCSLTIALPILSCAGLECSVVPTAVLSAHGGFPNHSYRDLTDDLNLIKTHFQNLNMKYDAIYSGFLGSYKQIEIISNYFDNFKNENTLILVDPVMGDNGKLYSMYNQDMLCGMSKLCSKADIIVPNLTEVAFLLGEKYQGENFNKEYIENSLKKLADLGSKKVVITGIVFESEKIGVACYDKSTEKIEYICNNAINEKFHGTGDIFASVLLAGLMNNLSLKESAKLAMEFIFESIEKTIENKSDKKYGVCFEKALPNLIEKIKSPQNS